MKMSINHKTSSTGLIPTYSHQQNIAKLGLTE